MQPDGRVIKTCPLGDGVTATLVDATRHYFGGYYHVRILVSADVPLRECSFAGPTEYADALRRLGSPVRFRRTLEKMAVPEQEIDAVRQHLLESFDGNVLPYLLRDGFVDSFVQSEYRRALKPGGTSIGSMYGG